MNTTIAADSKCSICYGRGIMKVIDPDATGKFNIFHEKECQCITRQRVHQEQVQHFKKYKVA